MDWIVSELFYPDEVSTALIMTEIAEEIAKTHDINIICGPSGYEKSYKAQQKKLHKRITIYRVRTATLNKNKLSLRLLRLLLLSLKMSYKVIRSVNKEDHLLVVTNPAFLILALSYIKRFKKFKLSILIHDVFPENLVPADILSNNSWKYNVLKSIYDSAYRKADKLIVLGNDMKELMVRKLQYRIPPIEVITNWSDEDIIPIRNFNKSAYLGIDLKGKVVIGFAGNLGRVQGLPEFLNSFKMASNKNIVLMIIGDGALRDEIALYVENEKMTNVILLGAKPRSEQNLFLNACDIGLITLKEGMKGLAVPSKTYNIMAAGKPLLYIGDKQSEIDTYIKSYSCGWSFSHNEKDELIKFLKSLSLDSIADVSKAGENSYKAAVEFYTKEKILCKFLNIS